jgi:hypothetical protein
VSINKIFDDENWLDSEAKILKLVDGEVIWQLLRKNLPVCIIFVQL